MDLKEELAEINYLECLVRPRLNKSLQNFVNKYSAVMTEYHAQNINELQAIIERAYNENLNMIVQKEYNGYEVLVWRG